MQKYINEYLRWINNEVFPFWAEKGLDQINNGFFELINENGNPKNSFRRSRLVARQIYSFSKSKELGWTGDSKEIISMGLNFLEKNLISQNGQIFMNINIEKSNPNKDHDLYDYAFVFLCLSELAKNEIFFEKAVSLSNKSLNWITNNWRHHHIGFKEDPKVSDNLRANPHMHLLEASLSWEQVESNYRDRWESVSDEVVNLLLSKLYSDKRFAVSEYFDLDWNDTKEKSHQVIEPGHQYEWGWLLLNWAKKRNNIKVKKIAIKLINTAETYGFNKDSLKVINALNFDHEVIDNNSKLWQQTERLKAWNLISKDLYFNKLEREESKKKVIQSLITIKEFHSKSLRGIWKENYIANKGFALGPTKASSLYHLIAAASTLKNTTLFK